MKALDFYKSLLACNMVTMPEGNEMSLVMMDNPVPLTVSKKALVLPTNRLLDEYNSIEDKVQVFHPVSENVMRGDSPVFNFLKRLYRTTLSVDFETLCREVSIWNSTVGAKSKHIAKEKRKYLVDLPEITEKDCEMLEKVFQHVDANGDNKIIDITVTRGGKIGTEEYNRICQLRLPLLKELLAEKKPERVFGVKLRKRDVTLLIALHKMAFSNLVDLDTDQPMTSDIVYEEGTNHSTCPNFVAITNVYGKVKQAMVKISEAFHDAFEGLQSTDLEWLKGMESLEKYRALIPSFPGNDGDLPVGQKTERKRLERDTRRIKVTPLGTVRELPQETQVEETVDAPMTYAEVLKQREQDRLRATSSRSTDRYTRDDRHQGRRRRGNDDIDVSSVDPNYAREHQREETFVDRRRRDDRYSYGRDYDRRDRVSRTRNGYDSDRDYVQNRYYSGRR